MSRHSWCIHACSRSEGNDSFMDDVGRPRYTAWIHGAASTRWAVTRSREHCQSMLDAGMNRIKLWKDAVERFGVHPSRLTRDLTRADKFHLHAP